MPLVFRLAVPPDFAPLVISVLFPLPDAVVPAPRVPALLFRTPSPLPVEPPGAGLLMLASGVPVVVVLCALADAATRTHDPAIATSVETLSMVYSYDGLLLSSGPRRIPDSHARSIPINTGDPSRFRK